jgi:hypothetical protein
MAVDPSDIQLTPEQQKWLAAISHESGKPWPIVFSEALARYRVEDSLSTDSDGSQESFYDAAVRVGLLGSIDDAPPDLSTNPRHMEGFGRSGASSR